MSPADPAYKTLPHSDSRSPAFLYLHILHSLPDHQCQPPKLDLAHAQRFQKEAQIHTSCLYRLRDSSHHRVDTQGLWPLRRFLSYSAYPKRNDLRYKDQLLPNYMLQTEKTWRCLWMPPGNSSLKYYTSYQCPSKGFQKHCKDAHLLPCFQQLHSRRSWSQPK